MTTRVPPICRTDARGCYDARMPYRVLVIAIALLGCNKRNLADSPEGKDLDRWINHDFALPYAYFEAAMQTIGDAKAEDYNNDALCTALQTRTVPYFHKVTELGSKVTPPKGSEIRQKDMLLYADTLEKMSSTMANACAGKDAAAFAAAHGEMMYTYAEYLDSEHWLDENLAHFGVKRVPVKVPD